MDQIRIDNKGHNSLRKLSPTSTLALCRKAQVPLIDSTMSWPGPGDSSHCHTGVWTAGAAPGNIWGEEPKWEDQPQQVQSPLSMASPHCTATDTSCHSRTPGAAEWGLTLLLGTAESFDDVLRLCWRWEIPFRTRGELGAWYRKGGHEGCWRPCWGPCPAPCSYRVRPVSWVLWPGMGITHLRHFQTALSAAPRMD